MTRQSFNALIEQEDESHQNRDKEMSEQEAIQAVEIKYEHSMKKSARIFEDELQDLNLGSEDDPKMVRISIHV